MYKKITLSIALFAAFLYNGPTLDSVYGQTVSKVVGELFGKPVTEEEFNYFYKTALMFTRSTKKDSERTDLEVRQETWNYMAYVKEATSLGIKVTDEELKAEIKRLVAEKGVDVGSDKYTDWVASTFGESVAIFEDRVRDLLLIKKFSDVKSDPEVTVTEAEMEQKFKNQNSSFESEYIRFDTKPEAEEFIRKVRENPILWKETYIAKKPDGQKGSSWINSMALEALIDLWKIPTEDAYRILGSKPGDFIAADYYYGLAVFRLLSKKEFEMDKYTDKKKEEYKAMITHNKKRMLAKAYFDDMFKRAALRDFVDEKRKADKLIELKMKTMLAIETNQGIIKVMLYPEAAPLACENFVGHAEKGYYNGVPFHRVIKDFMIQSGDPTGTGAGGESIWKAPFVNEVKDDLLFDKPGLLAMANSGPDTNASQFFITTKPTPHLNGRHTIFGEVISGLDVVKKIEAVPVDSSNRPKEEQKIIKAYVEVPRAQKDVKSGK